MTTQRITDLPDASLLQRYRDLCHVLVDPTPYPDEWVEHCFAEMALVSAEWMRRKVAASEASA